MVRLGAGAAGPGLRPGDAPARPGVQPYRAGDDGGDARARYPGHRLATEQQRLPAERGDGAGDPPAVGQPGRAAGAGLPRRRGRDPGDGRRDPPQRAGGLPRPAPGAGRDGGPDPGRERLRRVHGPARAVAPGVVRRRRLRRRVAAGRGARRRPACAGRAPDARRPYGRPAVGARRPGRHDLRPAARSAAGRPAAGAAGDDAGGPGRRRRPGYPRPLRGGPAGGHRGQRLRALLHRRGFLRRRGADRPRRRAGGLAAPLPRRPGRAVVLRPDLHARWLVLPVRPDRIPGPCRRRLDVAGAGSGGGRRRRCRGRGRGHRHLAGPSDAGEGPGEPHPPLAAEGGRAAPDVAGHRDRGRRGRGPDRLHRPHRER